MDFEMYTRPEPQLKIKMLQNCTVVSVKFCLKCISIVIFANFDFNQN
jgi:hypothetical protein